MAITLLIALLGVFAASVLRGFTGFGFGLAAVPLLSLVLPPAQVDEVADYKEKTTEDVKSAARRLAGLSSAPASPPSLVHGYAQLQRLKDGS